MSKITPKNLSYDSTLPPFLARLRADHASSDGRHTFAAARPQKKRSAEDEAEDEPVYFNEESGETLSKSEWEARENEAEKFAGGDGAVKKAGDQGAEGEESGLEKWTEKVASIGGGKKRKVGKVVGRDGDADEEQQKTERDATTLGQAIAAVASSQARVKKVEKAKTGKKSKKVKLSFDD